MPGLSPPATRDLARTWNTVKGRLELEMNRHTFRTYVRNTSALAQDGETLVVGVPTSFACDWLNQRLSQDASRLLAAIGASAVSIDFRLLPAVAQDGGISEGEVSPSPLPPAPPALLGSLDCECTFERYVEAEGNRVALQVIRGLLDKSGHRPSPVVLTGEPGLGKTHLLNALGCEARALGWSVACLSAEQFTNRFVCALRDGTAPAFKEAIRSVDLFILDDLQYLEGKTKTLEEVQHTLDAIKANGGVVAVGSERHPLDLAMPGALKTRLSAGFVARLAAFNSEERHTFAAKLSAAFGAGLPDWALERIAGTEMSCVRLLRGAVHAAIAMQRASRLLPAALDTELVRFGMPPRTENSRSDAELIEAVAAHFSVAPAEVAGRSRKGNLPEARAVAAAALRARGRTLEEIGAQLAGRNRSTMGEVVERGIRILGENGPLAADIGRTFDITAAVKQLTHAS